MNTYHIVMEVIKSSTVPVTRERFHILNPDKDIDFVKMTLDGNSSAFNTLVERHTPRVGRIISAQGLRGQDLEDAVQETFLKAYRALSTFRLEGRFGLWIAGIAVRTAKDHWRKTLRHRETPVSAYSENGETDNIIEHIEISYSGPEDDFMNSSVQKELRYAIEKLSPDQKAAVILFYFEELSVSEIQTAMGWGSSKIKILLFRARERLKKNLSVHWEVD